MFRWVERLKSWIMELVKSRAFVLILVFCVLTGILVQRVFYLQIVKGQEYLDDYTLKIQKTKELFSGKISKRITWNRNKNWSIFKYIYKCI